MPLGFQPPPQRGEVVDLAVEDRPDRAVLVGERLMAAGQVDDRQPAKPQRGVVVAVVARVVRTAVDDPVHHRLEGFRGQSTFEIGPDRAADAAHAGSLSHELAECRDQHSVSPIHCRVRSWRVPGTSRGQGDPTR